MDGQQLKRARERQRWTQAEAARRAGVSQPYWSLMERGRRPVSPDVLAAVMTWGGLPPTALPLDGIHALEPLDVAAGLAALGYPGFAYLAHATSPVNPAALLLAALRKPHLDARAVAGLPWLLLCFAELDWTWLLDQSKRFTVQNRLGFLVAVARDAAKRANDDATDARLAAWLGDLDDARLVREDTFVERATEAERRFLRERRSEAALHWNILSSLRAEHLAHVA